MNYGRPKESLDELETRVELARRYCGLCKMVGLDLPLEDALLVTKRIIDDPEVAALRMQPAYQLRPDKRFPAVISTDWQLLFEEMGPVRRAALAARCGVKP
jgi:hypothetical protein